MLKAYKFRLYPTKFQQEYFVKTFGCVRFVYNKMLEERIRLYKESKLDPDVKQKLPTPAKYKPEFPFLKEVDSLSLANAQMDLNKAYQNFFRDKSVGFPKFKSKHNDRASYTTNNLKGSIRIEACQVKLPKIGFVKLKQHRPFTGVIKSATISMTRMILSKKHEKIANQRQDFLHKLSKRIVDDNQVIVVETLKSKNMMKNHKIAKSIGDVSWYEFVRQLAYKCKFYGRTLITADQWYASTQICSSCGIKSEKKAMDVREWSCICGALHDRDINASINLLMLAY